MSTQGWRPPGQESADPPVLREAARRLRSHTDDRWVEVADQLVARVLVASQPSHPIRAQANSGAFHVAAQVVVSQLRASIDPVPDCEPTAIQVQTDGNRCTGVTIALAVRFGTPLIPLADEVRRLAQHRLRSVLGPVVPEVDVSTMRVHIADVTPGDPKV